MIDFKAEAEWYDTSHVLSTYDQFVTGECYFLDKNMSFMPERMNTGRKSFIKFSLEDNIRVSGEFADATHWSRIREFPWAFWGLVPFRKGMKILDAGSGRSSFQFFLAEQAKPTQTQIYNIDLDPKQIGEVQVMAKALGLDNLHARIGDLISLDEPDNYFSRSDCISVLEHIPRVEDRIKALKELMRVTKEKLLVSVDVRVYLGPDGMLYAIHPDIETFLNSLGLKVPQPKGTLIGVKIDDVLVSVMLIKIESKDSNNQETMNTE